MDLQTCKLLNADSSANNRPLNLALLPDHDASTEFKNHHRLTEPDHDASTEFKNHHRLTEPEKAEKQTENEIIKRKNSSYRQGTHVGGGELG
ncbi:hypothetical protein Bca4012_099159 [Brassica carinata]